MMRIKRIPKFESIAEEARFWDTHDITDYLSEMKEVKVGYHPRAPKQAILAIRLQETLKNRLEEVAKRKGVNLSTLLRVWLVDKIKETEPAQLTS